MKNIPVKREPEFSQQRESLHDNSKIEQIFENARCDKYVMAELVKTFCLTYLYDAQRRPLVLRPLQLEIVVSALTYPDGNPERQRKVALLAPRGSGKSYALSVAIIIYMFFKRFRELVFVVAPTEPQADLIFDYVYRHFRDSSALDRLVEQYKLHNKPHIKLKGSTILRKACVAAANQGHSIRGQHPSFLVIDESPLIPDNLFIDNVEPCIKSRRAPFINLGTPKSRDNHMWRYLYDDIFDDQFTRQVFTWRDAVKKGNSYEPPYTEEDMLRTMLEWGEDSIHWKTEYECQFVETLSAVFNPETLKKCFIDAEFAVPGGLSDKLNTVVAVDIGKSINSTVITVWILVKNDKKVQAQLVYIEEIRPDQGGHSIPVQRQRIAAICEDFDAGTLIMDTTGVGGGIEDDMQQFCKYGLMEPIRFIPFVFTGGAKGSKPKAYNDYKAYIQNQQVLVPNPAYLKKMGMKPQAHLMERWFSQHKDLQYVMADGDKVEKINPPSNKHDDMCDSSVIAIHALLSKLPIRGGYTSVRIAKRGDMIPGKQGNISIAQNRRRRTITIPRRTIPRGI